MRTFLPVLSLLSLFTLPLNSQPSTPVPIPLEVRHDADGFSLINHSTHRLIGVSMLITSPSSGAHMVLDGLDSFWSGIDSEASIPLSLGSFGDISVPDAVSRETPLVSVDWALFDDGEFFGPITNADALETKSRVRSSFFKRIEASSLLSREQWISEIEACVADKDCKKFGGSKELVEWTRVLDFYHRHMLKFGERSGEFVKSANTWMQRYPRIRRVGGISDLKPKDEANGWAIGLFGASCKNEPGYFVTSLGNPGAQCQYSTFVGQYRSTGEPPTLPGYKTSSNATCNNVYTGAIGKAIKSNFEHAVHTIASDPGGMKYLPRHYVSSRITTNALQQMHENWVGDTTYFGLAYGYPEKAGPSADVAGGNTWCTLFFDGPPYGAFSDNTINGYPDPFATHFPAVLLLDYNTVANYAANGYGFFIANYEESWTCGDPVPFVTPWETVPTAPGTIWSAGLPTIRNDGANGAGVAIGCLHEGGNVAGPGPVCNPYQSWCCCMATYNDWALCSAYGLTPTDGCGGPAAVAYGTSFGANMLTSTVGNGSAIDHSKIGVSRGSGTFLLDLTGENSYIAGETTYLPSFIPPLGAQSTDVPVSGDWNGTGKASIGMYRPSTGQWFLDTNGNGVWDAGDTQATYGGVTGDIPVVGNWQGSAWVGWPYLGPPGRSRDCIGIYRSGIWILDLNCNNINDYGDSAFPFGGLPGDVPVAGPRFRGGAAQVGVVRCYAPNGYCISPPYYWVFDGGVPFGGNSAANHPVTTVPGWSPFAYGGLTGDKYVMGDWLGKGIWYPGIYRNGVWLEDTTGAHTYDTIFNFGGLSTDYPLVGIW